MFFIVILAVVVFAGQALAEEPVSILTASSGEVSVIRHSSDPGGAFPSRAGLRQMLYEGDVVKTGPGAKAKLLLGDDSLVVLGERSEMKIMQVVDGPASAQRSMHVGVVQGFVRVAFQPMDSSGAAPRFTIETPVATMAALGSSEGFVKVTKGASGHATFWSLENTWEVTSADPSVSGMVRIPQGHSTDIVMGERPGDPKPVAQQMLAEFRDSMTMRETALTRPSPSNDRGDFIYQDYMARGWLFASRPKRYKTMAESPQKKSSYGSHESTNGQGSPTAGPAVRLVSAVPEGLVTVLHKGFEAVFSENGK